MIKNILFFVLTLFFTGCIYDPPPDIIYIYNNSDKAIYVTTSCDSFLKEDNIVTVFDTLYAPNLDEDIKVASKYRFQPFSYCQGGLLNLSWRQTIEECDDKTLNIFFIVADTLENYSWTKIHRNKIYNTMNVTLEDLDKSGWLIEYQE